PLTLPAVPYTTLFRSERDRVERERAGRAAEPRDRVGHGERHPGREQDRGDRERRHREPAEAAVAASPGSADHEAPPGSRIHTPTDRKSTRLNSSHLGI